LGRGMGIITESAKIMTYPKSDTRKLKPIVKQLDSLVSKIVIARDGKCVLCGSRTALGCGHLFKRRYYGTRWDLRNCNCLCNICNGRDEIEPAYYTHFVENAYGENSINELDKLADQIIKPPQQHAIYRELQEVAKQFGIHAPDIKEIK
jgi:hypothetical protein